MSFCQYGFYAASAEEPALCDNDRTCKGYFLDSSKETLRNSFISFSNSNEVLRARVALLVIADKDLLDLPATMGTIVRLQQFPEFILPWGRFELDAQVSGWFEPVDRH